MSQEASGLKEERKKVFKRAFFMASGTLTSRILGLFRDMAMGALFDRAITDAWTAAFRIPNLFRRLFGEGSLSVSFVPVFSETIEDRQDSIRARNLLNGFYSLLLILVGSLSLLAIIFTPELMSLMLNDVYRAATEKWLLTIHMARIMFGFIFCIVTYAYFMGILNALGSFGIPAVAPALLNISMLVFTFLPDAWFEIRGEGLAWGVLVGGILQVVLLWRALQIKNYMPQFQLKMWNQDIRHVFVNMAPGLVGMGFVQFSTLISLYYASSLTEGSISYIYWADRLLEFPISLISVSIGSALLPSLSETVVKRDQGKFSHLAVESLLQNLFLAWPAALGLYFLAEPIVGALFMHGRFTVIDLHATSSILKIYSMNLLLISFGRVISPLYYSLKNTHYPALGSLLSLLLQVGLTIEFVSEQGVEGVILAGTFALAFNTLFLLVGLRTTLLVIKWGTFLRSIFKFFIAGLALVGSIVWDQLLGFTIFPNNYLGSLCVHLVLAIVSYFSIAIILRCEQAERVLFFLKKDSGL